MADYTTGANRSKAPLYIGVAAIGLVIILGIVSMGGRGSDTPMATPLTDPEPITGPEAIEPPSSEPLPVQP